MDVICLLLVVGSNMTEQLEWEQRVLIVCLWLIVLTIAFVFQTLQINRLTRRVEYLELLLGGGLGPSGQLRTSGIVIGRPLD